MNKKDKYRNILEVALSKASQALSDNDFEKVSESMGIIAESYGKYKEIKKAEDTLRNADFATLRRVFENAIPKLFVSKSKALKEITNVIREDKNLIGQFRFIDAMRRFNNSSDSNSYVCESIDLACRNIDAKGVSKSNEKLAEALIRNGITDIPEIGNEERLFNENCSYVLSTKKNLKKEK